MTQNFFGQVPCAYYSYGIIQDKFHNFCAHIRVSRALKSGRAHCAPPRDLKVAKTSGQIGLRTFLFFSLFFSFFSFLYFFPCFISFFCFFFIFFVILLSFLFIFFFRHWSHTRLRLQKKYDRITFFERLRRGKIQLSTFFERLAWKVGELSIKCLFWKVKLEGRMVFTKWSGPFLNGFGRVIKCAHVLKTWKLLCEWCCNFCEWS